MGWLARSSAGPTASAPGMASPRRGRWVDPRQQLLEPPHPRRERVGVGLDRLAQETRQIGAVLVGKVCGHRAREYGVWAWKKPFARAGSGSTRASGFFRYKAQPRFDNIQRCSGWFDEYPLLPVPDTEGMRYALN
jgi:hypothetical protein